MKESEAEKLVCPFIQHAIVAVKGLSPTEELDNKCHVNINCITTKCMAWVVATDMYGYCVRLKESE